MAWIDPTGLDVWIKIVRDTYTDDSVTGRISVASDRYSKTFNGFTLETTTSGDDGDKDPIDPGIYKAKLRRGGKVELRDVPNFKHIQIHIGNNRDNVKGCFAVGKKRASNEVSKSKTAMQEILNIIKKDKTGNITVNVVGPSWQDME